VTFKLGTNSRASYSIVPVVKPTDDQRRLYRDYLKAELVKGAS
jgi:hypothetical protein